MNKLIAVVGVAATVFVGAFSTQYSFKADYVMKNSKAFPNGYVTGTLYYRYDSENALNSRVRYDTSYYLGETSIVSSDLYFYGEPKALFSFCDKCTASVLSGDLEPWWKIYGDVCSEVDGFLSCTRSTSDPHGVVKMVVKSGDPATNGFTIKSVTLNDGNELELTGFSSFAANDGKFDVPSNCPTAVTCRSYMDLVFVLDTSRSVDPGEWKNTKNFVINVTKQMTIGPKDTYVGVIEFNGPYQGNRGYCDFCPPSNARYIDIQPYGCKKEDDSGGCQGSACKRYLDDYPFDTNCKADTKHRANVLVPLTKDDVINRISKMENTDGNTCQRYGLEKAYDMLFTNNGRCNSGVCPTPVVIVVTDGADQCHASTITAAERLRNKMEEVGGFLLEVGVGLISDYDKDYIANLSSKLLGYNATYNVDNYAEIEGLIKNVTTPVCELTQLGGTCGPTCKGFCACSKCVCPMCGGNGTSQCKTYQCDVANADPGCNVGDVKCVDPVLEATKCYDMWCDAEEPDPAKKCKVTVKDCKAVVEAAIHRQLSECEYMPECVNGTVGCNETNIQLNHTFCQTKATKCQIGKCAGARGCVFSDKCEESPLHDICRYGVQCNGETGQCEATQPRWCNVDECNQIVGETVVPLCVSDDPCIVATCDKTKPQGQRCTNTSKCGVSTNLCRKMTCDNGQCGEEIYDSLDCASKNTICTTYTCDPDYDNGKGGCRPEKAYHEETECTVYECTDEEGWKAVPRCTTDEPCKVAKCLSGGKCYDEDIDCREALNIDDECHDGACDVEGGGCQMTIVYGSFIDICGNCKKEGEDDEDGGDCVEAPEKEVTREGLAGAAVALIVIGAIILGAAIAASTVFGTKALIDRARGAENQAVVSNPLFEESQTEMANPAFVGDTV